MEEKKTSAQNAPERDAEYDRIVSECFDELRTAVLTYNPAADMLRVRAAFDYAEQAHRAQKRRDGSPYLTHVVAAAIITAEMWLDEDSVVAALLHDVLEDTPTSHADIARIFGQAVADVVEGVTKLTRVQYTSKEEEQMENLRKMLFAMAKDIRVILIKIADRLHNMRTMAYQTPNKQRSKSFETMEIYAPIAHRLGMQKIKWELEDLALIYLDPLGYQEISHVLERKEAELREFMEQTEKRIRTRLDEANLRGTTSHRLKHIYSIYRKMIAQKRDVSEIFDLCAFRVIVDNIPDCYNVLGHIHDMFKPVPGRFKDYISTPKPNAYQSIHTTVIGSEGIPFEVQIRTWEMHHTAEYGVAAHWKYKTGETGVREGETEKFAWVRQLLESQQDSDAQDFVRSLKIDMFDDEVFVFTPKGDVINLPAGATPIDYAYAIHSAIGNRMTGAKINGRIVPLNTALQNGDIVEVLTSKSAPGPSRDWLKFAKSGEARSKIKQWFKKEKREENIVRGREMFEAEFRRTKIPLSDLTDPEIEPLILKKLAITSLDDMYAAIGYGGMTAVRSVNRVRDEIVRARKPEPSKTALDRIAEISERNAQQKKPDLHPIQGVLVEGLDNCLVRFSRCCTPVPGDEIVGFITRGKGISIHREDCPNHVKGRINPSGDGRWINVEWASQTNEFYSVSLKIHAVDRNDLVLDIATVLKAVNARVRSFVARDIGGGRSTTSLMLEVHDLTELRNITSRLSTISGVSDVIRAG